MSKRRKKRQPKPTARAAGKEAPVEAGIQLLYERACQLAEQGQRDGARRLNEQMSQTVTEARLKALLCNDRASLAAVAGETASACQGFQEALAIDPQCEPARANLALLQEDVAAEEEPAPALRAPTPAPPVCQASAVKVAILSFLFNWPSTGGGIVHTTELARFLARAGYEVRHFYARHLPWGIGRVEGPGPCPAETLEFDEAAWNVPAIRARFRAAVDAFAPDYVLITDAWNMKPHLAEAMRGYPCLLRFAALECLCPLNNVRLLADGPGRLTQCPKHQLATPEGCRSCLRERGHQSGGLHQSERALAGAGTPEYHALLCRALQEAEAVLVLNPFTEAMLSPYAKCVRVVPWGMDPARFPWPWPDEPPTTAKPRLTIFQAGVVDELMKGFGVLHAACEQLWRKRRDFELVATGTPPGPVDAFTRYTGWVSQEELPRYYHAADVVAVPTVAQEGLSRTSVEAMAAGKPVLASRIGGLPFTVGDGATGLLCEPGDVDDLARKLEMLLDDADLRRRLGRAGRRRFEEDFTWDVVIERHYRPLLCRRR